MTPLDRLAAFFSPTRRLIGPDGALVQQGGALGPFEWIVPRSECLYRRLDFSTIARGRRSAAAVLAVKRLYPDSRSRHYLAWTDGVAHAWVWSLAEAPQDVSDQRWLPEPVLLPPPESDGARLLRLSRGFEGQIWRQGQLQSSHWWPALPDEAQWRIFLRGGAVEDAATAAVPSVQTLPWRSSAWGARAGGLPWTPATLERLGWASAAVALGLALGWQLAAQLSWSIGSTRLNQRLETLRQQATPLLEARERAQNHLETLQAYRRLQAAYSDYTLMAEVVAPLPADARLVGWRREGRRLQAVLQSGESDPRVFVSAFQQHPLLEQVSASPAAGAQQMQLDFTLPAAEIAGGES